MRENALYCVLAVLINPSLLWHFAKVNFLFSWSRNLRCLKRRTLLEADPAMELFVTIVYCWKQIAKLKQCSYQKWYWKLRSKSFKCYIQFNITLHVIRMSFLCYSYVLACHLYVTCIISFVICNNNNNDDDNNNDNCNNNNNNNSNNNSHDQLSNPCVALFIKVRLSRLRKFLPN